MKQYAYIIFDVDHTLLDYTADEKAAFKRVYERIGLSVSEELLDISHFLSEKVWTKAGLYDVHSEEIQRRFHELYRSHVTGIFQELFLSYPCQTSPQKAGTLFLESLEAGGSLLPHAEEILRYLSKNEGGRYEIIVATNGLSRMQRNRLQGLDRYINRAYISEEVNAIKPTKAFFDSIIIDLKVSPSRCLMVGDSLYSDIAGASYAGMDSCWLNPLRKENTSTLSPTYEIGGLDELRMIL